MEASKNPNETLIREGVRGRTWLYVGIDPGVNTGFAVWDSLKKKFKVITGCTILTAIKELTKLHLQFPGEIYVRFDDARKSKLPPHLQQHASAQAFQGIGSVKRDCSIWQELLENLGIQYEAVAQQQQKMKKLDNEKFCLITKHQSSTNQHGRDAA